MNESKYNENIQTPIYVNEIAVMQPKSIYYL